MGEYRFITTTGSGGVAAAADSAAKSHAIRAGIRHGWATTDTANNQSRVTTRRRKELQGRFRLIQLPATVLDGAVGTVDESETAYRRTRLCNKTMTGPTRSLSSSNGIEPFDCLPIPQNHQVNELTQYFLATFRINGSEAGTKTVWFSYAMQNAVVMHSTIALSAACLTAKKCSDHLLWQEGLRQKGEAMRLIGEWLLQTKLVCDDTRCAAIMTSISTLCTSEVMYGNFEAANAHLLGVQKLFYSFGGTEKLRDEVELCKAINVADMFLATAIRRLPLFPLLHTEDVCLPQFIYEQASQQTFHTFVTNNCGDDLFQIFSTLRLAICAKRSGSVSPNSIRVLLNIAEYRLLEKLYGDSFAAILASDRGVVSATALAAHLFMYAVLREVPTNNLLMRTMSSRIQKAVQEMTATQRASPKHAAVLEWVACVGILGTWTGASEVSVQSMYFATLSDDSRHHPKSTGYGIAMLGQRLSEFLWDAEYCNQTTREAVEWGRACREPSPF